MATVREVVLPHHQKEDGTFNVKIRVTHNRRSSYIDTIHYIGIKQLRKDFTIKDAFILDILNPVLKTYRDHKWDIIGALIAIIGACIIIYMPRK